MNILCNFTYSNNFSSAGKINSYICIDGKKHMQRKHTWTIKCAVYHKGSYIDRGLCNEYTLSWKCLTGVVTGYSVNPKAIKQHYLLIFRTYFLNRRSVDLHIHKSEVYAVSLLKTCLVIIGFGCKEMCHQVISNFSLYQLYYICKFIHFGNCNCFIAMLMAHGYAQ